MPNGKKDIPKDLLKTLGKPEKDIPPDLLEELGEPVKKKEVGGEELVSEPPSIGEPEYEEIKGFVKIRRPEEKEVTTGYQWHQGYQWATPKEEELSVPVYGVTRVGRTAPAEKMEKPDITQELRDFTEVQTRYIDDLLEFHKQRSTELVNQPVQDDKTIKQRIESARRIENLDFAKQLMDKAAEAQKEPTEDVIKELYDGLTAPLAIDFFTLGINEIVRNFKILDIANKKRDGEEITSDEEAVLIAYTLLQESLAGEDKTIAKAVGEGVINMIPYMIHFAATGGVTAGIKPAIKNLITVAAKSRTRKMLGEAAGYTTQKLAQAAIMPMFAGEYAERRIGEVERELGRVTVGEQPSIGEAAVDAFSTSFAEVFTEGLGGLADKPLKKVTRLMGKSKGTKAATKTVATKIKDATQFNSITAEYGEELVNSYMQAALTGDRPLSEVWDGKEQLTTLLTVGAVGGALSVVNKAQKGFQSAKPEDNLDPLDNDTKGKVIEAMDKEIVEERADALNDILTEKEMNEDEVNSILAYAKEKTVNEVINETEKEVDDAERIRKETEEAGRKEAVVEGEEERLRVRRAEKDRLEAEKREEVKEYEKDIKNKSEKELEERLSYLENKKTDKAYEEYNAIEQELNKREWDSVVGVTLDEVRSATKKLRKKEKEMPYGWGIASEIRDLRESDKVAERYANPESLSDADVNSDFVKALRGNPKTWMADAILLRESANEASRRGVTFEKLLNDAINVYERAGYDRATAESVIKGMLRPIFEGAKIQKKPKEIKEPTKAEEAKTGLSDATERLMQSMGVIKFAEGTEKPDAVKALMDIADNIYKLGVANVEELMQKIKNHLKGYVQDKAEREKLYKFLEDNRNTISEHYFKKEPVKPTEAEQKKIIEREVPEKKEREEKEVSEKVQTTFDKQREDIEKSKKPFIKKLTELVTKRLFDVRGVLKDKLYKHKAFDVIYRKNLVAGSSSAAKQTFKGYKKKIFDGLSKEEETIFNDFVQAKRDIDIDKRYDKQGKSRISHMGGNTKETYEAWLKDLKETNPKLYEKLDKRATEYFNAYKELLKERYEEGRISKEVYEALKNNEYAPRKTLMHLLESEEMKEGQAVQSVETPDIKALSEGDINAFYNNSRWLLETSTLATKRAVLENRANRALHDFAKENPEIDFVKVQKPKKFDKKTGEPVYPEPPTGWTSISYYENGMKKSILMKNEYAKDWYNQPPIIKQNFANVIRIGTGGSILRAMATGMNPVFALANFPRDIAHVLFFTDTYSPFLPKAIFQIGKDVAKIQEDLVKREGDYKEYIEEGGGMDFMTHQGKVVEGRLFPKTKLGRGMETLHHVAGFINESSELAVRLAVRGREIEKQTKAFKEKNGRYPNEKELSDIKAMATAKAREYLDFSQGGDWVKAVDTGIPYTNASFQGFRVAARYIKRNPGVFSIKLAQLGAVSVAMTLHNLQYDEWDDISDDVKARYLIWLLPFTWKDKQGNTRRYMIRIPKTFELQIFSSFFEGLTELISEKKYPTKQSIIAIENSIPYKELNPMDVPIVDAMYTYTTNFDRFRKEEVWKGSNVEAWAEYYKDTENIYKQTGEALGVSPVRLKAASEKMLTNQNNNIYTVILSKGYELATEGMTKEQRTEYDKNAMEHIEEATRPLYKKYFSSTSPYVKEGDFERYTKEEFTKRKLNNDKTRKYIKEYKDTGKEKEFKEWHKSIKKEDVDEANRILNIFKKGKKTEGVDFYYLDLSFYDAPAKVKAKVVWEEKYAQANKEEKKEIIKQCIKAGLGGTNSQFYKTLMKLEKTFPK